MGLFSKEPPEQKFWKWFAANAARLRAAPADERLLVEICAQLEKVQEGITCELSTDAVSGPRELIISADGIRERIPAVQRLVAAAPSIQGWKVIAFRPAKPGLQLGFGDKSFALEDIPFRPIPEGGRIGVEIHLPGYREGDERAMGAAFLLLDCALGEYAVMTQVGSVSLRALSPGGAPAGTMPMSRMADHFAAAGGRR
jgi:hypothetical protein